MAAGRGKTTEFEDCVEVIRSGWVLRPRLSPGPPGCRLDLLWGLAAPSAPAGRCPCVKTKNKTGGGSLRSRVQAKACQTKGTLRRPRPLGPPALFNPHTGIRALMRAANIRVRRERSNDHHRGGMERSKFHPCEWYCKHYLFNCPSRTVVTKNSSRLNALFIIIANTELRFWFSRPKSLAIFR